MSNWKPIDTVPIEYKYNEKSIICKWKLPDETFIVGSARWVAPNPSMYKHWAYEGKWTPIDPVAWQEMPEAYDD